MPTEPSPAKEQAQVSETDAENLPSSLVYRPPLASRIARGGLIVLALIVTAGFVLLLLPQGAIEKIVRTLQASKAAELPSDRIALLYLGDEIKGKRGKR